MKPCYLFDTTLRDGSQAEGVSFSLADKLEIARLLDDFGIDYIEGGWPGSNPKDTTFFHELVKTKLKNAKVTVFGSTRRYNQKAELDENLAKTIASEAQVACIFGKTWDFHVLDALNVSLNQNLDIIAESISYLKKYFDQVIFDAEHFFDGYLSNQKYSAEIITVINQSGADFLVLCDTNGGTLPWQIDHIISEIKPLFKIPFGIHAHNDSEVAVANSLIAIKQGAKMVQGTINGFGERCGNANLVSIIANCQLKMGLELITKNQLANLTKLSKTVSEISNLGEYNKQPFTGTSAFAHKGGIHVSAVMKNSVSYEHIDPNLIGNTRRVLVSELSGKSNLNYVLNESNFPFKIEESIKSKIISKIKELENKGYAFEGADASLFIFLMQESNLQTNFFELISYRVIDERLSFDTAPNALATVKYKINNIEEISAAEGLGPVDSLAQALIKGLSLYYPLLKKLKLVDYKVRILNSHDGTAASVRVLISFHNNAQTWHTVGVGFDIISASFKAITDGINYNLYLTEKN